MTPALGAGGGSMSNLSFVRQNDGTLSMRERKGGKQPHSRLQTAREVVMTQVSQAWGTMSQDERDAWERYSEELHAQGATPSLSRPRPGYRVFSQLGLKALQVRPEGPVPIFPPSAPFFGDGARVSVSPSPLRGRGGRGVRGESALTDRADAGSETAAEDDGPLTPTPLPRRGEGPSVVFTCLVPNSPGVATELLVQSLPSPGRKGSADKYRSRGFVEFAEAGQTVEVPLPLGTSMVAVRFVEIASGQASGIVPLGRVTVGGSGGRLPDQAVVLGVRADP